MISSLKVAKKLAQLHDLSGPGSDLILNANEEKELFRLAEQNSALIFTVKQLERQGAMSELLEVKKAQIKRPLEREARRYQKVLEILKAFEAESIPIIALKGTALGAFLYHDPFYKRMNDFDFLIQLEDLEKVKKTLRDLKYTSVGDLLEKEKKVDSSHHLAPWVSDDLHAVLGIHWNLISPKRTQKVPKEALFQDAVQIQEIEYTALRLSNPHFLMHLMLHLPAFKTGIREVSDLMNLGEFASDSEINEVSKLAQDWNANENIYRALAWVRVLKPNSRLLQILPKLEARVPETLKKETNAFLKNEQTVLYFRTLQLSKVEKAFAQSWLSPSPKKRIQGWLRSWKETLFPSMREGMAVLKKSGEPGVLDSLQVRLFAPFVIWFALCKEHGTLQIYAITFLNFANVLKSGIQWALKPSSAHLNHPAEKILEELE